MSKIMLSMPEEIIKQLDSCAESEHRNRSEFVREAVRYYIASGIHRYKRPIDDPQVRAAVETMNRIAQQSKGKSNSTAFIRKMRDERRR